MFEATSPSRSAPFFFWRVFLVHSIFGVLCGGGLWCSFVHDHKKKNKQPLSLDIWYLQPLFFKMHIRRATSSKKQNKKQRRIQKENEDMIVHLVFPSWCWWWVLPHGGGPCPFVFPSIHSFNPAIPSHLFQNYMPHVLYMHLLYPSPHFPNVFPMQWCIATNTSQDRKVLAINSKTEEKRAKRKSKFRGGLSFGPRGSCFLFLSHPSLSSILCFTSPFAPFGSLFEASPTSPATLFIVHVCLVVLLGVPYSSITLVFSSREDAARFVFGLANDVTSPKPKTKSAKPANSMMGLANWLIDELYALHPLTLNLPWILHTDTVPIHLRRVPSVTVPLFLTYLAWRRKEEDRVLNCVQERSAMAYSSCHFNVQTPLHPFHPPWFLPPWFLPQ